MKQKFLKFCTSVKDKVVNASRRAKLMFSGAVATVLAPVKALAQELAGTGYDAGTNALEEVASELVKYVPYVVNLCYALAGIVAIVGAISVYIAMNNEEQDVKNILVLQNWLERTRKEVTDKVLSIKRISELLNFPILAQPTLKKI